MRASTRSWGLRLRDRLADESGVTLVELMTVILMLGITFTAAFFFYQGTLNRTTDTQARTATLGELRNASERIARDARESESITAVSASSLTLSGPPVAAGGGGPIVYDCAGSTCTRTEGSGSPSVIIEGVQSGAEIFSAPTSSCVTIDLRKVPEGRDRAIAFERGVALRNISDDSLAPCPS